MCLRLTCTICGAALAPGTPSFTHTAAAELACEACGQRVLALVFSAHKAETQALLLWFVRCRGGSGGQDLSIAMSLCPVASDAASLFCQLLIHMWP